MDGEFHRFSEFLERFMSLHHDDGGVGLHPFKLKISCGRRKTDVGFHIGTWMLHATRLNVKKIVLKLLKIRPHHESFTLPVSVFNCAPSRDLRLDLDYGILSLPANTFIFSSIELLTLKKIGVSQKLFGELISSCKWLKILHLVNVYGVYGTLKEFNITSSSLERLKIEDSCNDNLEVKVSATRLIFLAIERWSHVGRHSLRLHAPRLTLFVWNGTVSNYS